MNLLMKMMLRGIGKITKQTPKMIQMEWIRVDFYSTVYINKIMPIEISSCYKLIFNCARSTYYWGHENIKHKYSRHPRIFLRPLHRGSFE